MINVFGSKVGKEEIEQITDSISNQWMGMGPKTKLFESKMSERLQMEKFILVDSGSNGLYMALTLLELPKGSEVIVPSFTWVSCAQVVMMAGCIPVFADVDVESQNITAELIKPHITKNTSAIMVVHYAGLPVDLEPILELGIPVVEDACHAVDSLYKGKPCGTIGDVGVYSFDAVKNLSMGEGGGVVSHNQDMMTRADILRYCGIGKSGFEASTHGKERWWEYNIVEPFIKMNPSDIAAAIGVAQLEKLDALQAYREKIWNIYQDEFAGVKWIQRPLNADKGDKHSYFTYFIRVSKRDQIAKYLFDNGIYTTLRYHPLHLNPVYHSHESLPNSELLNNTGLNIPLHPSLTMNDVDKVIEYIKAFEKYN